MNPYHIQSSTALRSIVRSRGVRNLVAKAVASANLQAAATVGPPLLEHVEDIAAIAGREEVHALVVGSVCGGREGAEAAWSGAGVVPDVDAAGRTAAVAAVIDSHDEAGAGGGEAGEDGQAGDGGGEGELHFVLLEARGWQ